MIKATLILFIALSITALMRRRSAAERHMVWAAAIIAAALLPVFSGFIPSWQSPLAGSIARALPALPSAQSDRPANGDGVMVRALGIEANSTFLWRASIAIWIIGSLFAGLVLARELVKLVKLVIQAKPIEESGWKEIIADLSPRLELKDQIRVLLGPEGTMPMTFGFRHSRIVLPACAEAWPEERRRVVLAHEMAHVRRRDFFFQIAAQLACAIYWFNPLFWIASHRQRWESERACDDAVLQLGVAHAEDYAVHLLEIARSLNGAARIWSPALPMAKPSGLERRFAALLDSSEDRRPITRLRMAVVTVAALCVALPVGALRATDATTVGAVSDRPLVEQYSSPPLYSDEARAQGIEGTVTVEVFVDVNGNAEVRRVVRGLGFGLDENALVAVRRWRFIPGAQNGRAVGMSTLVDVEFSLRTAELNELIANDMASRVGPGVTPPGIVRRVEPLYRAEESQGPVVLDVVVQEDGTPKIVRVIQSQSWKLDESAITAVEQWRFSPATMDGMPVRVRLNVAVDFNTR
jgi:TonB family protein